MKRASLMLLKIYNQHNKYSCYLNLTNDKGLLCALNTIEYRWKESKIWVAKSQFNQDIKTIKELKKHGEFLNQLFLMIEKINTFENRNSTINMWHMCCDDLMQMEMIDCFEGIEFVNSSWKKAYVKYLRQDLKKLKNNENPFKYKQLHDQILSIYIDKALYYKFESNVFYTNFWKPFIDSYSAYITDFDKNPAIKRAYIEGNSHVFQVGKGNSPRARKKFDIL